MQLPLAELSGKERETQLNWRRNLKYYRDLPGNNWKSNLSLLIKFH